MDTTFDRVPMPVKPKKSTRPRTFQGLPNKATARLIDAAPNWAWRTIIALARFGGLRTPVRPAQALPGRGMGGCARGANPCDSREPLPTGGEWPKRVGKLQSADHLRENRPAGRAGAVAPAVSRLAGELGDGLGPRVPYHHGLPVDREHGGERLCGRYRIRTSDIHVVSVAL